MVFGIDIPSPQGRGGCVFYLAHVDFCLVLIIIPLSLHLICVKAERVLLSSRKFSYN